MDIVFIDLSITAFRLPSTKKLHSEHRRHKQEEEEEKKQTQHGGYTSDHNLHQVVYVALVPTGKENSTLTKMQ